MQSSVAIGALIGICFAMGWAYAGLQGISHPFRVPYLFISVLASIGLATTVFWRWRFAPGPAVAGAARFDRAIYRWVVAAEALAIPLSVIALNRTGSEHYVMPAIAFIVGVHFFGLARAMLGGGAMVFVWIGAGMCLVASAAALGLARSVISPSQTTALVGFGCAFILWLAVSRFALPSARHL